MTPTQIPLPLEGSKHLNHGLFSDYFLDEIIPRRPDWLAMFDAARTVRDQLRTLRDQIRPAELNEAQLEEEWIRRVLQMLGHHYAVQVNIQYRGAGRRTPDYLFTSSEEEARAFTAQIYDPAALKTRGALAVGDAKRWGANLDQSGGPDQRNPSQQIDEYLRYSELPWGILTDGRYWRLYERHTSKNNAYYAVDLMNLLDSDNVEDFLYFYAFFQQAAFTEGWLAAVLEGSESYSQRLSDTLEDQVYEALELIAQGFLACRRNKLTATPETLKTVYEQSLVLLYRLLFILYAESRDTLPIHDNPDYAHSHSLDSVKLELTHLALPSLHQDKTAYYQRLNDLFFSIDQGDPAFGLPAYNGRLFSVADHPFLTANTVGDLYLMQALDCLTRVPDAQGKRVFVDYRDLDVRHLGAIYEKLLEYQLDAAAEPLALKEGKYVSASADEKPIKQPGEVYLRTGSNERKITGSYYTPDYIVRFIVERTLEPLLTEITGRYAAHDADGHWIVRDSAGLRDAILALNLLDPATGSGHFLVDATAYLAEWLRSMTLAPADLGGEDELTYWKRQVVNSCIYGVDVNPLAVELARLSLWLATLSRGKPLSFLDHHIKCGNSLVGARMREVGTGLTDTVSAKRGKRREVASLEVGQEIQVTEDAAFTPAMSDAVDRISAIERIHAEHVSEVKQQESLYAQMAARTEPLKMLANVAVARYFGLEIDSVTWRNVYATLVNGYETGDPRLQAIFEQASRLTAEQHFLHWELEFPEIFFNPDGTPRENPGFDAVIGNPPYVRQERIQPIKPFLATHHSAVYDGSADLYIYFYHQGLSQLRRGGWLSYITANKWLRAGYGEPLRGYLAEAAEVRQMVDFGHAPIFRDADTFPIIMVIHKPEDKPTEDAQAEITQFPREALKRVDLREYTHVHGYPVPLTRFSAVPWSLEPPEVDALMEKLRRVGIPLKQFINAEPFYGLKTGFNDAYLIDTPTKESLIQEDSSCATMIKPYLRGQDIKRWSPDWAGEWMILLKSSENYAWAWSEAGDNAENIFAETYPSLYRHFKDFEDRLRQREDQGRYWWELRSCIYYEAFSRPQIIHTDITWRPQFALPDEPFHLLNTAYLWPTNDLYLLAVVNSPLMWAFMWRSAAHGKDEALRLIYSFVVSLPIAPPTDAIRAEVEPAVQQLIALTRERRQAMHEALDWLRVEFEIATPGQKIEAFPALDEEAFVEEVRKRRPRAAGRLSPAGLRALREMFGQYTPRVRALDETMQGFERRLSDLQRFSSCLSY